MSRRPLCAALVVLLASPVAFAASGNASLTIYHADNDALFSGGSQGTLDAGHALVHETRALDITAGNHELRVGGLPATIDPEAIAVGFGPGSAVSVLGQRVMLANASANGALDGAIGSEVSVSTDSRGDTALGPQFSGELLGASDAGLLIRGSDGKVHFVHRYASVTLPADSVSGGSSVLLDVDAKSSGRSNALLTYTTSGLGWRAAYNATLAGGSACRMQFKPEASIANRSGRDYDGATIKLVAGQPNLGNSGPRMYSMAAPVPMAAEARKLPQQSSLGDYRSFTLGGAVTLPNGTVTLTPLYPAQSLPCQREYVIEDGGTFFPPKPNTNDYGAQDYQDRAIASTLSFTAPDALPAGTLRAWTGDRDGAPTLLGEGAVADTPKGKRVAVELGQSFDLRASRERTAFHVDAKAHTMSEAYRITLTNGGDAARTVTVREHPNRWREWTVASSSIKPSKQTPQLLEYEVPVPANGSATLTYTVQYTWSERDM
ncbi:MAG: DUF4139 domain-containing protein [Xanthomonadales bacterium]|nr:DUF4139 domain-containing protein [Xanthomonadales bacterium]ODU93754.1 MAG: hypothetical protein ABT18_06955 [Rhodanobacter sp. SCN 66-43]OJY83282.1 MAG: hypothetical protein BGP23_09680 [Xanthomonadales bacterium 66-474]